jgi:hypothetical protein
VRHALHSTYHLHSANQGQTSWHRCQLQRRSVPVLAVPCWLCEQHALQCLAHTAVCVALPLRSAHKALFVMPESDMNVRAGGQLTKMRSVRVLPCTWHCLPAGPQSISACLVHAHHPVTKSKGHVHACAGCAVG